MTTETEETTGGRSTVSRTIRLTPEMMVRLQAVCEHLGVTVGAYLTQEVGRAVAKDELALLAKLSQEAMVKHAQLAIDKASED